MDVARPYLTDSLVAAVVAGCGPSGICRSNTFFFLLLLRYGWSCSVDRDEGGPDRRTRRESALQLPRAGLIPGDVQVERRAPDVFIRGIGAQDGAAIEAATAHRHALLGEALIESGPEGCRRLRQVTDEHRAHARFRHAQDGSGSAQSAQACRRMRAIAAALWPSPYGFCTVAMAR